MFATTKKCFVTTQKCFVTTKMCFVTTKKCFATTKKCFMRQLRSVIGYITTLTFVFLNFDELWEMNRTLFECGLRKSVELKDGRVYDITSTLEKTVKLSSATVKCKHCDRSFKV